MLRLFAQALKDTCREYDYVARMGGDEFVVIAPGLTPDASAKKTEQMRALARHAGSEVCGEDILSLSVGRAVFPADGKDAEQLLAEADRRMYLEKQKQLAYKDRRSHPRLKCRVTIELTTESGECPSVRQSHRYQSWRVLHRNQHDRPGGQQNQAGILHG